MTSHHRYTTAMTNAQARMHEGDKLRTLISMSRMEEPRKPESVMSLSVLPTNGTGAREALKGARANHKIDNGVMPVKGSFEEKARRYITSTPGPSPEQIAAAPAVKLGKRERDALDELQDVVSQMEKARRRAEHGPSVGEVAIAMNIAATGVHKTEADFYHMKPAVKRGWLEAAMELMAGSLEAPMQLTVENICRAYWSKVDPRREVDPWADWLAINKAIWTKAVEGGRAVIRSASPVHKPCVSTVAPRSIEERAVSAYNAFYEGHIQHFEQLNHRSKAGWVAFVNDVDRLTGRGLTDEYIAMAAREKHYRAYYSEGDYKPEEWDNVHPDKKRAWVTALHAAHA